MLFQFLLMLELQAMIKCYCLLTCQISDSVDNNSSVGASFSQDTRTVVQTRNYFVKVSFVNVQYLKICDVTATSLQ